MAHSTDHLTVVAVTVTDEVGVNLIAVTMTWAWIPKALTRKPAAGEV